MSGSASERHENRRALAIGLAVVAGLTAIRVAALFATPLQLYPDEAQYWVWSRTPAFGYFSKPPVIAWLIWLTTRLGDGEPLVRLSAPLVHAVAALALQRAGRRLYDARTGLIAAMVYMLMPGVQLSSGVVATDAPLLMFLSLAVWAYAALLTTALTGRRGWAAVGLGLSFGGAFMAKYAALYVVTGAVAYAVATRRSGVGPTRREAMLAALLFALVVAPNLAWNAAHGFATVVHTVDDAHLLQGSSGIAGHLAQAAGFAVAQLGVFGPGAALALGAAAWAARSRAGDAAGRMLLALTAPALLVVLIEALAARANANWAAAAYAPGAVLAASRLARVRARPLLWATVAGQGAAAALFVAAAVQPALADALGLGGSFKRARGWREEAAAVAQAVRTAGPLSAVVVDSRFHFNALSYYDRALFAAPGAPPLRMWLRRPRPRSQPEATAALTPATGRRVLAINAESDYAVELRGDFRAAGPANTVSLPDGGRGARTVGLFVAEDFRPRPRDPVTGLPLPAGGATR